MNSLANNIPHELRYELDRIEEKGRRQSIEVASSFIFLIDLRDSYTGGHSTRVATYCQEMGMRMGLDDTELDMVVTAASLHDVGKIGVSDPVLLKNGKLTDEEFGEIKKHPEYGWMVLRNIDGLKEASLVVLHHHERLDGRGYPGNLKGDAIPLGSRIIAVADTFDAMTTNRPYRKAMTIDQSLTEIERCSGTQFDPEAAKAFISYMGASTVAA
tara:strand:- start:21748 stop:22389 length:642 start_codon:yes stop_codon:yes gene_type:complete